MRFANPAGLWMATLMIPVLALHILRPRRPSHVVSSTFLWRAMERPVTSATPFRKFRPSWLLLLQLLAVAFAAIAIANPVRTTPSDLAQHTVFLVDGSGSMLALDGAPDRLGTAVDLAIELRQDLPAGGVASVIEIGSTPRVLLSSSSDPAAFEEAVRAIDATSGSADFAGAFALAEGLERSDAPIGFVLVSDGGLSEEEQRLLPPGTTYEQVGKAATNRAVLELDVEPTATALRVSVTIANKGGPAATQTLRLDVDGRTRERVELELGVGQTIVHATELTLGDRVDAFLEGEDLLAADNKRTAVAHRRQAVQVAIKGDADPFLDALLGSIGGLEVLAPDATDTPDLTIYIGTPVPASPPTPFLAIRPPGGAPGVTVNGEVENPALTLVEARDPLLAGVDLSGLAIATAQRVQSSTAEVLLGAESAPLLLRGRSGGVQFAYFTFALTDSNLPLQLAFPLLGDRLIAELTGASLPPTSLEVGDTLAVPPALGGVIIDPFGAVTDLAPGSVGLTAERPGVWTIASPNRPELSVAVNPAAAESTLTPVPGLPTERRQARPGEATPQNETSWRPWVIGGLLAILALEFLLARRKVGVSPKQWRLATGLRVLVAFALLAALFDIGFDRGAGEVATVFVVDASDSLGSSGRAEALEFVRNALAEQPGGARSGVVLFGGDARIEALLSSETALGAPSVQIDPSQTDLAAAMRLGAAILPDDARRRVVLVSDGRATSGDTEREAGLLSDQGVVVDTVLIDSPSGADVAVSSVRAPTGVAEGEAIPVDVKLESTVSGPAVVTLRRDGQIIETRQVDLVAGDQTVRFTDVADTGGPRRYQVDVQHGSDAVSQNNTAFAAVEVEGPPRVLMVQGTPGAGNDLAAALTAGGLTVETTETRGIPGLDELVGYSSIILVDVDQRQLTTRQVGSLSGAVRDAGRGLVTIGGDQSYGLGGYYTSELERLLPVVSEILDPKRRQTVAEVLAIDTSGSMGACHCAEGQFSGNRFDGGVNKTDISRAAAARTIAALGENDEVGVLAFDVEDKWIIDLQKLPAQDVVNAGLAGLNPDGGTNPIGSLETAAKSLRESNAALKHVILFTDGFTSQNALADLADEAAALAAEGITVSVIATGEGAAVELAKVAEAGQGRFYPGRDIQQIPEILMEEAILASRDFVNEGEFLPTVTSANPVVSGLTASPPLLGYLATTEKPGTSTLLRVGPDEDPLLVTWQVGLGTATSWTSDASDRWSQLWASWDGYVGFWSRVVRDTFPIVSDGTSAVVDDGVLRIRVETDGGFASDATATARVTDPLLGTREIPLDRVGANEFVAEIPVDDAGIYVVGTSVINGEESTLQGSALASQSYGREYEPGVPDAAALARIGDATGGRSIDDPAMAFDKANLDPGTARLSLTRWLLLAAAIGIFLAVVLSRLTLRPATPARRQKRALRVPKRERAGAPSPRDAMEVRPTGPPTVAAEDAAILDEIADADAGAGTQTVSALLEQTRAAREKDRQNKQ